MITNEQRQKQAEADEKYEFTADHIAAATGAHANGKVAVLDRGPPEPTVEPHDGDLTEAEQKAANDRLVIAKREHAAWHEINDEPVVLVMSRIDADHATNADPIRYIAIPRGIRAPVTLEERVALIEKRMGPLTPEESDKIQERDAKLREEQTARAAERNAPADNRFEPRPQRPYPEERRRNPNFGRGPNQPEFLPDEVR